MIVTLVLRSTVVAMGISLLGGIAAAQGQGTTEQRNACMADAFRFCLSSIPNHKRIEACLRANRRSLSTACYREIYDDSPAPPQKVTKGVMQGYAPE
mgnify:CR=1 FL=1